VKEERKMWVVHSLMLLVVVTMFLSMVSHPPPKSPK
jgi:hypothetical protein